MLNFAAEAPHLREKTFIMSKKFRTTVLFGISLPAVFMAAALASCSGGGHAGSEAGQQNGDTAARADAPAISEEPGRQSLDTLTWRGERVVVEIQRTPASGGDENVVTDETGAKYRDNEMHLRLVNLSGNKTVVDRMLRKSDFRGYIDADTYSRYVLEGLVVDRVDGPQLVLAASVANPTQDDELLPFKVLISPGGGISISRDTDADMVRPDEEE